jgi:hypothetical protein
MKSKKQKRLKRKRDTDHEGKRKHVQRGKKHENIGKEYTEGGKDDELPIVNHVHKGVKRTMGRK